MLDHAFGEIENLQQQVQVLQQQNQNQQQTQQQVPPLANNAPEQQK